MNAGASLAAVAVSATLMVVPQLNVVNAATNQLHQVSCLGSESISIRPGLTYTPKRTEIGIDDDLTCTSLTAPGITSATVRARVTRDDFSCVTLLGGGPASRVFRWNTGESSTFEHTSTVEIVGGQFIVTQTGRIASGKFAGSSAIATAVLLADLTACNTDDGLAGAAGTYTLQILL